MMTYTLESIERAAAEYKAARDRCTPGPWRSDNPDDSHAMNMYCVTRGDAEEPWDEDDLGNAVAVTLLQSGTRIGHQDHNWDRDADFIAASRSTELPEMVEWLVAKLAEARDVCRDARRYVAGAYECAFPDQSENDQVLTSIDAFLKATEAP